MVGVLLLLLALFFFMVQLAFLLVPSIVDSQFEYIDNRAFYVINSVCALFLLLGCFLLLRLRKMGLAFGFSLFILFVGVNIYLIQGVNDSMTHHISRSPSGDHTLIVKHEKTENQAVYYRPYYKLLARPLERIVDMESEPQITWVTADVAAITYVHSSERITQFIATYGSRGGNTSYYNVVPEIQGLWQGEEIEVLVNTEGVTVREGGRAETFTHEQTIQYGTLAVGLTAPSGEARWTIALGEDFDFWSVDRQAPSGTLRLFEATMDEGEAVTLEIVEGEF